MEGEEEVEFQTTKRVARLTQDQADAIARVLMASEIEISTVGEGPFPCCDANDQLGLRTGDLFATIFFWIFFWTLCVDVFEHFFAKNRQIYYTVKTLVMLTAFFGWVAVQQKRIANQV